MNLFGSRGSGKKPDDEATADKVSAEAFQAISRSHAIMVLGPDRVIRDVNAAFCLGTGHAAVDCVGKSHDMIVRPKAGDRAEMDEIWKCLERGADINGIYPRLDAKGVEIWLDTTFSPVMDATGTLDRVIVTARQITDHHIKRRDNRSQVDALRRSIAIIEFDLEGRVLWANELFLETLGYRLEEIIGKHHRIFLDEETSSHPEYRQFWDDLARGGSKTGEVKRISKSGETRWLQASYATVVDPEGRPIKVVKYAFDITETKNLAADATGQIEAIQRVLAVIEFDTQGRILSANRIFCEVMGYAHSEIIGQKHSMFIGDAQVKSADYTKFWDDLRAGREVSGNFERIGKGGKKVWLRASYNPIPDADGQICKVVKFALDTSIFQITASTMQYGLERAAGGDLSVQLTQDLGELDGIRKSFNEAISTMSRVIEGVAERSQALQDETGEINSATTDLANRTERQATTLADAAASIEELTASVKSAALLAIGARNMVGDARTNATRSSDIVRNAVAAMDEISASSKKISSITGLIDEIAFQTNLLALNAGVEAARAGDAGRGFSVVASEVRALAQRSSNAARDIATLISESSDQVGRGVRMVGQAGDALQQIGESVNTIHDKVNDIATSAQEQSTALAEVNGALNRLDHDTQQNAAMAEETNAATQALMEAILAMQSDVSYFQQTGPDTGFERRSAGSAKPGRWAAAN